MKPDSIMVNLPKNAVQYLIGFGLYLLTFGSFDLIKLILGLISFLISYSAIYPYNDLMDFESDKKDKFKKVYKALARGDLSPKNAITLAFGLPIIGLLIGSLVNPWYPVLLGLLLFQNFLHSSPQTTKTFKNNYSFMLPNMFLMQSIKFALGWLTFTSDLILFPGWLITTLSFGYLWGYVVYKKGISNIWGNFKKNLKIMIPLSILTVSSYFISVLLYDIKLPLLMLFPLMFFFLSFRKESDVIKKTFSMASLSWTMFGIIAVLLFLLNIPLIGGLNQDTSDAFERWGEVTIQSMDNDSYEIVCKINETLYSQPIKDLNDLNELFNISGIQIVISNGTVNNIE